MLALEVEADVVDETLPPPEVGERGASDLMMAADSSSFRLSEESEADVLISDGLRRRRESL